MSEATSPRPKANPEHDSTKRGAGEKQEKNAYRGTLNLPQTNFPMKANLVQNEPASQKRWTGMRLYERVREARKGASRFVFHDGPPYANGSIHLGHLMNKCLKDFVVRSRTMVGMDCPYVPGWDCHGLPIEHKVMTEQLAGDKAAKLASLPDDARKMAVRRECQKYAEKFQKLQAGQMERLLTLADYEHPYLTMSREYEGATLEVLASLMEQGLVYRALKAVHWSVANETALAEAELEYYDREDISVYVDFEAENAAAVYEAFGLGEEREEGAEVDAQDAAEDADSTHEEDEDVVAGSGLASSGERVDMPRPGVRPLTRPSFMIWTTTPWTLPANLAVAVNPAFTYALVWVDGNVTVMAQNLVEKVVKAAKAEQHVALATTTGDRLLGLRYRHPFVEKMPAFRDEGRVFDSRKVWSIVAADYVTLDDGTGLVHTAPGHGAEDYQTGLREGLPIYCPVRENGTYDGTVPPWLRGMSVWDANVEVTKRLRESGHLFYDHTFMHSYPHDWRGKTPVIFRATEQWFVGVDRKTTRDAKSLRELALAAVGEHASGANVKFVPEWGRNRMRGMLESRPDWCISRQRAWGLPIPAFFTPEGECFMTAASVRAVAKVVRAKGSDAWFTLTAEQLLAEYDAENDPDAPAAVKARLRGLRDPDLRKGAGPPSGELRKGNDILDVWFESGSSWNAVMRERSGGKDFPVELYLEGSDQHRGWFQTSLLPSLGMMGRPPFRAILTHGFMVDKDGRKMSKSLGNTLEVETLLKDYGADVCRWWVCSLAYDADVKVDRSFFDVAGESYRKVRNTLRFMLSNLYDYEPARGHSLQDLDPRSLDAWVLAEFDRLVQAVRQAYEGYDFQAVHKRLYDFCNDTLSATYLAAIKDRLYCDKAESPRRRRTQAALHALTDGLCRLLAPVMCHTADEAYRALVRSDDACVHMLVFPEALGMRADAAWSEVMKIQPDAAAALERAKDRGIENPLDAGVVLPDGRGVFSAFAPTELADLLGVSRVTVDRHAAAVGVDDLRGEPRCERSWKRDGTVKQRSDGGMLSQRDAEAVGVA